MILTSIVIPVPHEVMYACIPLAGGRATKHVLLGFADTKCAMELRQLGFPSDYGALGEAFETGEVGNHS